jgi:BirA family biotin operon repressor/biotin-[acetyl-CoA-carboxylase] ligase
MILDRPAAEAAQLSFVAALAVRDLAERYVPEALVRLKWPNDVLIAGAKAAGILIESGRHDGGQLWLAVGVGVNLTSAPEGLDYPATSLASHLDQGIASAPGQDEALEALSKTFAHWLAVWRSEGFEPLRIAWTASAAGLGARCVARFGDREVTGEAEGLGEDGALVLRLASGELQRITAGDVFFG